MSVCVFDGTHTEQAVCPTCNDYKGLEPIEPIRIQGFTSLDQALRDAMGLMEEYRENFDNEEEEPND
jgi:uncharacterized protein YegL